MGNGFPMLFEKIFDLIKFVLGKGAAHTIGKFNFGFDPIFYFIAVLPHMNMQALLQVSRIEKDIA